MADFGRHAGNRIMPCLRPRALNSRPFCRRQIRVKVLEVPDDASKGLFVLEEPRKAWVAASRSRPSGKARQQAFLPAVLEPGQAHQLFKPVRLIRRQRIQLWGPGLPEVGKSGIKRESLIELSH